MYHTKVGTFYTQKDITIFVLTSLYMVVRHIILIPIKVNFLKIKSKCKSVKFSRDLGRTQIEGEDGELSTHYPFNKVDRLESKK